MRILCFGDPEGKLQKRRKYIEDLIKKFNPEFTIFLGDYYSTQLTYYNKLSRYRNTHSIYDLFPESNVIKGFERETKFVFVYGNKDIRPTSLRLAQERIRKKLDNWFFIQDLKGELKEIGAYILNGSCVLNVNTRLASILRIAYEMLEETSEELFVKKKKKVRKQIMKIVKANFSKRDYNLIFGIYFTSFRGVTKIRTNADILLTHTPPYLKHSKLIFGNYPDLAVYKIIGESDVVPAHEDDPEAIKKNVGNQNITKFILKNGFNLVLCGHIHEGSGISLIKETNTIVVNPGSIAAFQNKERIIPFTVVDIKERSIRVYLRSWLGEKKIDIEI